MRKVRTCPLPSEFYPLRSGLRLLGICGLVHPQRQLVDEPAGFAGSQPIQRSFDLVLGLSPQVSGPVAGDFSGQFDAAFGGIDLHNSPVTLRTDDPAGRTKWSANSLICTSPSMNPISTNAPKAVIFVRSAVSFRLSVFNLFHALVKANVSNCWRGSRRASQFIKNIIQRRQTDRLAHICLRIDLTLPGVGHQVFDRTVQIRRHTLNN